MKNLSIIFTLLSISYCAFSMEHQVFLVRNVRKVMHAKIAEQKRHNDDLRNVLAKTKDLIRLAHAQTDELIDAICKIEPPIDPYTSPRHFVEIKQIPQEKDSPSIHTNQDNLDSIIKARWAHALANQYKN